MKTRVRHLRRRCAASAAAGAAVSGAARAELVLATAAFTVLGIGGMLLVGQWTRSELPLRAAAPVASSMAHPNPSAELSRSDLDAEVLAAAPAAEPERAVETTESATDLKVAPSFAFESADRKALEEQLLSVLLGEGRHDGKLAFLRGLARSERADKVEWLAFAASNLPEVPTAKGESLAVVALGLIADLSERDAVARESLERLAFETETLHVVLRRRAAALTAERCPAHESATLRRRLRDEPDPSVVAAALEALDRRAEEPGVREWIGDFADWRRPVDGEP